MVGGWPKEVAEGRKGLKKFLVLVRSTVHLRSSFLKLLLLLRRRLLSLPFLEERDTGSFVVDRPVRAVVHVGVIEIRKFRFEGLLDIDLLADVPEVQLGVLHYRGRGR